MCLGSWSSFTGYALHAAVRCGAITSHHRCLGIGKRGIMASTSFYELNRRPIRLHDMKNQWELREQKKHYRNYSNTQGFTGGNGRLDYKDSPGDA